MILSTCLNPVEIGKSVREASIECQVHLPSNYCSHLTIQKPYLSGMNVAAMIIWAHAAESCTK